MVVDDLVHACLVGEEPGSLTVAVDVGHVVEDERCGDVDERSRIQHRSVSYELGDCYEEPQTVARMAVLLLPETSSRVLHRLQDATTFAYEPVQPPSCADPSCD